MLPDGNDSNNGNNTGNTDPIIIPTVPPRDRERLTEDVRPSVPTPPPNPFTPDNR